MEYISSRQTKLSLQYYIVDFDYQIECKKVVWYCIVFAVKFSFFKKVWKTCIFPSANQIKDKT